VGANLWSWSGSQGQASGHKTAANACAASTSAGVAWLGSHTGYTTTATNACAACHRAHTAHDSARLLKGQTDQVCFQCHDGNPLTGLKDLRSEFTGKMYVHPSLGPRASHDPNEPPDSILTRHAACDDCHNSHAVRADVAKPTPPQLPGTLLGQSGISENASPRDPRRGGTDALYEFEVCFKCHNEQSLRNDESFKEHWKHMEIASCATCHGAHGVPNGTTVNNGSLVNFDLYIVAPNASGQGPAWTDLTPTAGSTSFQGSCTLRCHGKNHTDETY
jgi:predicted CXXCH cytochrome family protein